MNYYKPWKILYLLQALENLILTSSLGIMCSGSTTTTESDKKNNITIFPIFVRYMMYCKRVMCTFQKRKTKVSQDSVRIDS